MPADVKRPSPNATASNWKGQQSYAGKDKRPASAQSPQERINAATPGYSKPAANARPPSAQNRTPPKVQGSYAGKDMPNRPATQSMPKPRSEAMPQAVQAGDADMPKAKPGERRSRLRRRQRTAAGAEAAAQPAQMNRPSPGMQQGGPRRQGHGHVRLGRQPRQRERGRASAASRACRRAPAARAAVAAASKKAR